MLGFKAYWFLTELSIYRRENKKIKVIFGLKAYFKKHKKCLIETNFYFFALQLMIWNLFYAEKTMLIKLGNLWYLSSKKVNFDDQYWLQCIKKVSNHRLMGKKIKCKSRKNETFERFSYTVRSWTILNKIDYFVIDALCHLF